MTIDEQIRRHLEDTTSSLVAPDRLDEVMAEGHRRRIRRGTFSVLGAAAVVAAVVSVLPLLLSQGSSPAPVATTPATSAAPSTTSAVSPVPAEGPLGAVVAGADGVSILDREGSETLALDPEGDVVAAYPDQVGGLIYHTAAGALLRIAPGTSTASDLVSPSEGTIVPIGPGRSSAGDPLFFYLDDRLVDEENRVMAVDLSTGEVSQVAGQAPSQDVSAGGSLVALVDRTNFECPAVTLLDLSAGELPSLLGDDCLPVDAGVSVSTDGDHLGLLAAEEFRVVSARDGGTVVTRSVPGAYMATPGPGGWAIRTPSETILLAADGDTWTLPAVGEREWVIPYAEPFRLTADGGEEEETAACSVPEAGLSDQDLPGEVAATRQRLWELATGCDAQGLADLARADGTILSFGGETDPVAQWEAEARNGPDPIARLGRLLATRPARDPAGLWAWPAVHLDPDDEESWTEVSDILGPEAVDDMLRAGTGYLGHRVGIAEDGTWQFFVAGD